MVDQVMTEFVSDGPKRRWVPESDHPQCWPGFAIRRSPYTDVGSLGGGVGPIERHLGETGVGSSAAVESD